MGTGLATWGDAKLAYSIAPTTGASLSYAFIGLGGASLADAVQDAIDQVVALWSVGSLPALRPCVRSLSGFYNTGGRYECLLNAIRYYDVCNPDATLSGVSVPLETLNMDSTTALVVAPFAFGLTILGNAQDADLVNASAAALQAAHLNHPEGVVRFIVSAFNPTANVFDVVVVGGKNIGKLTTPI